MLHLNYPLDIILICQVFRTFYGDIPDPHPIQTGLSSQTHIGSIEQRNSTMSIYVCLCVGSVCKCTIEFIQQTNSTVYMFAHNLVLKFNLTFLWKLLHILPIHIAISCARFWIGIAIYFLMHLRLLPKFVIDSQNVKWRVNHLSLVIYI